jgi:hypothetical protein
LIERHAEGKASKPMTHETNVSFYMGRQAMFASVMQHEPHLHAMKNIRGGRMLQRTSRSPRSLLRVFPYSSRAIESFQVLHSSLARTSMVEAPYPGPLFRRPHCIITYVVSRTTAPPMPFPRPPTLAPVFVNDATRYSSRSCPPSAVACLQ